jgi:hypothetical protein
LAPIQEKTREQVRLGAAKMIAQLKWCRTEIWRLKCHKDILVLDLNEDKDVNGDLEDLEDTKGGDTLSKPTGPKPQAQNGSPRSAPTSSGSLKQVGGGSPVTEHFSTPPTTAVDPWGQIPPLRLDKSPLTLDMLPLRRPSAASSASSSVPTSATSPPRKAVSPKETDALNEEEEDAGERHVLEQAGLLDSDPPRAGDRRPSSTTGPEETPERHKRSSGTGTEKDKLERNKIRRSLQRTLRDGAGHLSHHRSRKGKDSASSAALSDETVREEILSRGTGSFTVHGKKASVIDFGDGLSNMSTDERIKQRKQSQQMDDPPGGLASPISIDDDDFQSAFSGMETFEERGRRGSATSASTATARSFRELHRKYSSSKGPNRGLANLIVPSDEDSDAAISFSDGRRTPLPPLDDEDEPMNEQPRQAQFYTPEPPASPTEPPVPEAAEEDEESDTESKGAVERPVNPAVRVVGS